MFRVLRCCRRGGGTAVQPGFGRSVSRLSAVVMRLVQGQCRARRRIRLRPVVTSCPAVVNRRSRRRRGSQRRALPVRASIGIQASRARAICTVSSQIRFRAVRCGVVRPLIGFVV